MIYYKEGNQWVAECKELGTSTYGDSFEEIEKELVELIALHLNTLEELGEREVFFTENGIQTYYDSPPLTVNIESVKPEFLTKAHIHNLQVGVCQ